MLIYRQNNYDHKQKTHFQVFLLTQLLQFTISFLFLFYKAQRKFVASSKKLAKNYCTTRQRQVNVVKGEIQPKTSKRLTKRKASNENKSISYKIQKSYHSSHKRPECFDILMTKLKQIMQKFPHSRKKNTGRFSKKTIHYYSLFTNLASGKILLDKN